MRPKGKSERSRTLLNNIFGSGIFKLLNVVINLLIFRYSILLIGEEEFGVWLALLSFLTWFSALEVGVSNGVRNHLTKLFADKDFSPIKSILESSYKVLIYIYFSIITVVLLASFLFPLDQLFISSELDVDFLLTFQICICFYFLHYILFFVHNVLLATHKTKLTYLGYVLQNGIILVGISACYFLEVTPSLLIFCVWISAVPLVSWSLFSWVNYNSSLKTISPSLNKIFNAKPIKISNEHRSFFIIQLCVLTLFSTDNIIIINLLSGKDVSLFNITFKYFNILIVGFNLVLLPYWASFTDAFHKKDVNWIKVHLMRLVKLWFLLILLGCGMLYFAETAFNLWIGKTINQNWNLSIFMLLSILLTMWNSIFSYFLNSISKIKLQLNLLIVAAFLNIPLTFILTESIGLEGAVLASCIALLPLSVGLPIKTYRTINLHKA